MHCFMSFYIRDLSMWILIGGEQGPGTNPLCIPRNNKFWGVKSYWLIFNCVGVGTFNTRIVHGSVINVQYEKCF